jgi:hypothetical protein
MSKKEKQEKKKLLPTCASTRSETFKNVTVGIAASMMITIFLLIIIGLILAFVYREQIGQMIGSFVGGLIPEFPEFPSS